MRGVIIHSEPVEKNGNISESARIYNLKNMPFHYCTKEIGVPPVVFVNMLYHNYW